MLQFWGLVRLSTQLISIWNRNLGEKSRALNVSISCLAGWPGVWNLDIRWDGFLWESLAICVVVLCGLVALDLWWVWVILFHVPNGFAYVVRVGAWNSLSVSQQLGNVPIEPPIVPGADGPEAAEVPGVRRRNLNLESNARGDVREPLWSEGCPVHSQNVQNRSMWEAPPLVSTPVTHGYQETGSVPNSARVGNWNDIAANPQNGARQLAEQFPTGNSKGLRTSEGPQQNTSGLLGQSSMGNFPSSMAGQMSFRSKYNPEKYGGTAGRDDRSPV